MSEVHSAVAKTPAGLLRRLGAMVSDSLVVVGLLLLGSLLFVPVLTYLDAKAMVPAEVGWLWTCVYWVWLLTIWLGFFCFFWTRRGQTVGMQAWYVRVEDEQGALLSWSTAIKRLWYAALPWLPCLLLLALAEKYQSDVLKTTGQGLSALGLVSFLWMYVDPWRRTWYDRYTRTRVIRLPKP